MGFPKAGKHVLQFRFAPKADPKTRIWEYVFYFGGDLRKYGEGPEK